MDKMRLMEVLNETTYLISKGARTRRKTQEIEGLLWGVVLSADDIRAHRLERVDCEFVEVGVDVEKANQYLDELVALLDTYPSPEQLLEGPSYKHVSDVVGDDVTALRLFGLGHVLGLWAVLTPTDFGVEPVLVEEAADLGMIVISRYPDAAPYGLVEAAG